MRFLPVVLIVLALGCRQRTPVAHVPREEAVRQAREAAQDAFNLLSGELAKAIADGGPVAAIPVCSGKAKPLVADVSAARKVGMVRLSDRPRNPKQAAEGADLAAIASFRETIKRGDGWEHLVELEDVHAREKGVVYPRCLEGENACPPEDCGGPWGYQELLEIIGDPTHEEYADRIEWLGSMKGIDGEDFDPGHFDAAGVHLDDPEKRWAVAFNNETMTSDMRMFEIFRRLGAE